MNRTGGILFIGTIVAMMGIVKANAAPGPTSSNRKIPLVLPEQTQQQVDHLVAEHSSAIEMLMGLLAESRMFLRLMPTSVKVTFAKRFLDNQKESLEVFKALDPEVKVHFMARIMANNPEAMQAYAENKDVFAALDFDFAPEAPLIVAKHLVKTQTHQHP